jgi:DNA-binding protein HU-beta
VEDSTSFTPFVFLAESAKPKAKSRFLLTPVLRSRITAATSILRATRIYRYASRLFFVAEGSMNKQDLVAKIAQDTGLSKTNAAAAVESFFEGITKSLKKGQPITFVGFGTFKTAQRKARTARNPQTGAAIKIPKRRVVRFSAGKALKSALN